MAPSLPPEAAAAVLAWYDGNGRPLAFRASRDPYAILVSEVMAQQTQVGRVVDAWSRFIARFPTVDALAAATPADVLREWQGMGYDRRALHLRRAAIAMRDEHGGRVPDDLDALERLPGVGPYTARAVLAIAFGRAVGAVDTNVRRVLTRAVLGDAAVGSPRFTQAVADASVDPSRPGDWTHAVMDLGATVCRPEHPSCDRCPLEGWCAFRASAGRRLAGSVGARRSRRSAAGSRQRFETTSRWLRGRILDRLRTSVDGAWTEVPDEMGVHRAEAVRTALAALAREGLIEVRAAPAALARADQAERLPEARLALGDAVPTDAVGSN